MNIDYAKLPSPCYICDESKLEKNLKLMEHIQKASGAKILLALKGYAMWSTFEQISQSLYGCTASGLHEAKLADEFFHKEIHTYSPAFKAEEIDEISQLSDHIVFNSPGQMHHFKDRIKKIKPNVLFSLRINPEYSSSPVDLYNPCSTYSRLGTTLKNFDKNLLSELDGLNFHALCEQNVDALKNVLKAFEDKFSQYIPQMKYINFGGGHHITRKDYDVEGLIHVIKEFKQRYHNIDVYLEPGEAIGWQIGDLVCSVLDIIHNEMDIAILDSSAEAHMPDTLAMPYRADVAGADIANKKPYTYRLAGNTCLAGDIMGDYSFDKKLRIGDKVIFKDQMHYTFVKNTTFNGIKLPSLAILTKEKNIKIIKSFGYDNYKNRLS